MMSTPYETTGGTICTDCGAPILPGCVHLCTRYQPVAAPPIGCICPPGANRDCERLDCPRKGIKISAVGNVA
jgi:hypothetical protein